MSARAKPAEQAVSPASPELSTAASVAHSVDPWPIPDIELQVKRAPWSLGGVTQIFAKYEESDAPVAQDAGDQTLSVNTTLRANMEWTATRDLLLHLHAQVVTAGAPVTVACEVVYKMVILRQPETEDTQVFEFGRTVGVRALFPYVRAAVASISAQGTLGALVLQPPYIEIVAKT